MKKAGLINFLAIVFLGLGSTGCVKEPFSASYWRTFDGTLIIIVVLFLVFYTLATMRSSKH
jgi:hypothetical protein